ncbi:hypothetical protein [Bacteroides neonati]|uniref:hypothetical protein n=1 Tax=Bacteroides neonati TaxID=1347393 RepID=UPI0005A82337|nr:hypothetical protein [Bacteroides neonati]
MNKLKITTEVRSILLNSPEIFELIGERVFPLVAPADTDGDFIVYQRDGYKIESTKMGRCIDKPMVYINTVSDDYDRSQDLASIVYELLEGDFESPNMRIRLEDSTEDYADGKYIQVLLFSIQ